MKRLFIILIALCAGFSAMAQDGEPGWRDRIVHPKYDVRVSIGGPNALFCFPSDEFKGKEIFDNWKSNIKLSDIYEPYYELNATPTFTAEFNWHADTWVYLGADLSWNRTWGRKYDPITDKEIGYKNFNSAHIMGKAAFYFVQFPHIKIYSAIYGGLEVRSCGIDGEYSTRLRPAVDVSLFGAEWAGDVIFGFTEIILGTRMNVIKLGAGYRF